MSQTASAPKPTASPEPAGQPVASPEPDVPAAPQPGPVPVPTPPAPIAEPTPAPETAAADIPSVETAAVPEPTPAPEPVVAATSDPVATTAGLVPEPTPQPTLSNAASLPETTTIEPTTGVAPEASALPPTTTSAPMSADAQDSKHDDAVEPQNSLTKKFTEREWDALRALRAQLPDILVEAFPDNDNARDTPFSIWGVTISPQSPQRDARVSVVLMKFLRARNLSITEARAMLIGTLRWRESFNVEAALKEDFPQEVFANLAHISGKDKDGRLVIYNIYGGNQDLKAVFGDVQRFIRWRVALMEKSVLQLDFTELDQMIQVHDYEGVSLTSRDANSKAAAGEATNIFQNHYPEMLYKKFFVNVPTLLNWIFWIFKPIISANTLAKMSVVGTGKHTIKKALMDYISESEIPTRYGGEGEAF